jgi:hypothetical protein
VEAEHDDIHVEGIKIDYSLVNVLLVGTLVAVFKEEFIKTVHRPKYFGGGGVVSGDSIFVGDAVSSFDICHKFFELIARMLLLSKKRLNACVNAQSL